MSVVRVGSQHWLDWNYGNIGSACCFLCGIAFLQNEDVVLWGGCASAEKTALPFAPYTIEGLALMDAVAKQSGGFQPALNIFLHIDCVPSFCRRLLQDWERMRE